MKELELPDALIAQLSKPHKNTGHMVTVLAALPDKFHLDALLIKYWQVSGKVIKAATMRSRVGRLIDQGILTHSALPNTFIKVKTNEQSII